MKYIISTFLLSALFLMSFKVSERVEFNEFFKMAYDQSYHGLNKLCDSQSGSLQFEKTVGDFDKCVIRYDIEKGVHGIDFIRTVETKETGLQIMSRMEGQINKIIPVLLYKRTESIGENGPMVRYDYNSDDIAMKAKNPVIQMDIQTRQGFTQMIITLYEPLHQQ